MTLALTRRFEIWEWNQSRNWWVEGPEGAVNVQITYLPDLQGLRKSAELLGWVETENGWFFGSDVGVHRRSKLDGTWHQQDCPILHGPCWYHGSTLDTGWPLTLWAISQFDDEIMFRACEQRYREEFE